MDQCTNAVGIAQQIVGRDRLAGRQDVHADPLLLKQRQRLWANSQALEHAGREHDDRGTAIEKLDDVRRLNAGIMSRSGLAPVPGARSARVEFGVLTAPWPSMLTRPQRQLSMRGELRSLWDTAESSSGISCCAEPRTGFPFSHLPDRPYAS